MFREMDETDFSTSCPRLRTPHSTQSTSSTDNRTINPCSHRTNWTELTGTSRPSYTKCWLVTRTVQPRHIDLLGCRHRKIGCVAWTGICELQFVRCERPHWFACVQNSSLVQFSSCDVNEALRPSWTRVICSVGDGRTDYGHRSIVTYIFISTPYGSTYKITIIIMYHTRPTLK